MTWKILQEWDIFYGSFSSLSEAGFLNACSCRLHGESRIVPGTLNLALHVGDEEELVLANRRKFAAALGVRPERFTTCRQVHGSRVERVTEAMAGSGALALAGTIDGTDALITDLPDLPLLLFFADCVPVLLADARTGAIGLAHAGWRGTAAGIAAQTALALQQEFGSRPEDILAAIGPSIGACCYEVDDFVRARMPEAEEFFTPVPGKSGGYMLDLWSANRRQLLSAGLLAEHIETAGVCTAHARDLFCSYRAEQGRTGRMGVCLCRKGSGNK